MSTFWKRLAAQVPGIIVFFAIVSGARHIDGYPWGMPVLLVLLLSLGIAYLLEKVVTHAINTYFGFNGDDDDSGDGDDPDDGDDDDSPDDIIVVPDTPESLYEHTR